MNRYGNIAEELATAAEIMKKYGVSCNKSIIIVKDAKNSEKINFVFKKCLYLNSNIKENDRDPQLMKKIVNI